MSQLKVQLNRIKAIQSSVNILLVKYILHYMMQGYFPDGPKLFYEKTMSDRIIQISFLAGPYPQAIQIWCTIYCKVDIRVSWDHL